MRAVLLTAIDRRPGWAAPGGGARD
jgi:hypothetical protein